MSIVHADFLKFRPGFSGLILNMNVAGLLSLLGPGWRTFADAISVYFAFHLARSLT